MMRYLTLILAALALTGCGTIQGLLSKGTDFTRERIMSYCANTPVEQRELLRSQLVYSDGSAMIIVYCEPHGEVTTDT